ncbi:L-threonylcarbamoyladenylate synthase [Trueperella sp. LYQ141]|uniref:L-threonylcarbamoyladenylate synthase n=1 Tax=Trueperella sp. LYQ141 TaxID=3391058 RepID=UPI003983D683
MKIAVNDPLACAQARRVIEAGQVLCLPTDTVYGIGADPRNPQAITALLAAKSRTRQMPPPVLVASIDQARELCAEINVAAQTLMEHYWPGALTIILPARPNLGWDLGQTNGTVALRMPDSPDTLALLAEIGPLAVTSANLHGRTPARDVDEAYEQLGESIALYLAGPVCASVTPSTIIDLSSSPRIVRVGAIAPQLLSELLGVAL